MDLIATSTAWTRNTVNSICNRDYTKGFYQPPPAGWVKINIDGSFTAQSSSAVVGGVFRDHEREWLLGFVMKIGRSSVYQAKARAFYKGMIMASNEGFDKIEVESNNTIMIDIISNSYAIDNNFSEVRLIYTMFMEN